MRMHALKIERKNRIKVLEVTSLFNVEHMLKAGGKFRSSWHCLKTPHKFYLIRNGSRE